MIIWGGYSPDAGGQVNTGARYNPDSDTWTAMSTINAPEGRQSHTAVWSGSKMIVWGGYDTSGFVSNTGGRYDLGTDSWTATTTNNAPTARSGHTAVWTSSEMIVWGGYNGTVGVNTGARYRSKHRQLDRHQHDQRAWRTIRSNSGMDWLSHDHLGRHR